MGKRRTRKGKIGKRKNVKKEKLRKKKSNSEGESSCCKRKECAGRIAKAKCSTNLHSPSSCTLEPLCPRPRRSRSCRRMPVSGWNSSSCDTFLPSHKSRCTGSRDPSRCNYRPEGLLHTPREYKLTKAH